MLLQCKEIIRNKGKDQSQSLICVILPHWLLKILLRF